MNSVSDKVSQERLLIDLQSKLRDSKTKNLNKYRNNVRRRLDNLGLIITSPNILEKAEMCQASRKQSFSFFEDVRPPFFGTCLNMNGYKLNPFNKKHLAKRVFMKLENRTSVSVPGILERELDYDYDSGLEWEEPEDGESIGSEADAKDDVSDEPNENELDYNDGWLTSEGDVLCGNVAKDKGPSNIPRNKVPEMRKPFISDIYLDLQSAEQKHSNNAEIERLKRFSVEFLPKFSADGSPIISEQPVRLVPPTSLDILLEILSNKDRKLICGQASKKKLVSNAAVPISAGTAN